MPNTYPTQNLHGTLWPNCISEMVTINNLLTSANALSNPSIADFSLNTHKQR